MNAVRINGAGCMSCNDDRSLTNTVGGLGGCRLSCGSRVKPWWPGGPGGKALKSSMDSTSLYY